MKKRDRGKRLAVLFTAMTLILGSLVVASPAQAVTGNILPPFDIGLGTCVYQGYGPAYSHNGTSYYGLDLVTSNCSSTTATSGRNAHAPLSGTIYGSYDTTTGSICINTIYGSSITLTHIDAVITSGPVTAGDIIGTVASAGGRSNGGIAHLHLQMWSGPNCWGSGNSGIPFDTVHGSRICGAIDLPQGGSGSNGQWSGTVFTGSNCNPYENHLLQYYFSSGSWSAFDVSAQTSVNVIGNPSIDGGAAWARDTSNHLRKFHVSGGSWIAEDITSYTGVSILGNPAGVSGTVYVRDTGNHLRQFYLSGGTWTAFDISAVTGVNVVGDPVVDSSGTIWIRDDSNHLRQFYVSGGSWVAFDLTNATSVNVLGNPVPVAGGVWARDDSNHLRQFYVSGGSWIAFDVSAATGVTIMSDPSVSGGTIWARDSSNRLRQFYVGGGSWVSFDATGATGVFVSGNPLAISGGAWARDTNGRLRQFYVSGGSWVAFDLGATTSTTITGDPVSDYTGMPWATG